MASEHEVVFQWPHTEPAHVVVTGTFDQWSGSHPLTKTPTGFKGTVHIPWGAKVLYKFIVDGTWLVHEDQPTEADHDGNVNNVYSAPPAPLPVSVIAPQTHGVGAEDKEEAVKAPNGKPRDDELESPFVSPAVPGAFPKTPVVVVPAPEVVNEPETPAPAPAPEPTPILEEPKAPEPETPAPAPAPVPAAVEKPQAPEAQPKLKPATIPTPTPGPVAPRVPIPIVPVNAAENNPPVSPVDVSASAKEAGAGGKEREKEREVSTHAYSPTPRSPVLSPTAVEKKAEPVVAVVEPVPVPEPVSVPLPPSEAVTPPPAEEPVVSAPEEKLAPVAEAAVPKLEKAAPAEEKGAGAGNGTAAEEAKSSTNGHSETSSPARPSTPVKKAVFPSSGSPTRGGSPTGTASSSRKKRTSIFGKLKHVFHHDHDKETK